MLFNSLVFLIFAALFFAGWPLARSRANLRYAYIVVASFVFYGWWDWRFLFLIIGSGLLDFLAGLAIYERPRLRKLWLGISILGNVGSLMLFKYARFFAENLVAVLGNFGIQVDPMAAMPAFVLILPVGISFYTFQSMSYTIDVYKGQLVPTRNVLHFFAYLSMFPQLVAGPIIRAADLLPQLRDAQPTGNQNRWEGLNLILHGFFKKVVIADNLAFFVTEAFARHSAQDAGLYWWFIMTAFAFQIYCDFSGYSDIARGLAKWMGYDFMVNFNHPYVSVSLREFWSRWHISLSTWFRDYVYIPLGGSRLGRLRSEVNMWITMLVSGFWHGAAWTFIVWGGLHALGLTIERATDWPRRVLRLPGGRVVASFLVLFQVWITWVYFRAGSLQQANQIVGQMLSLKGGLHGFVASLGGMKIMTIGVVIAIAALRELYIFAGLDRKSPWPGSLRVPAEVALAAALAVACVFLRGPGSQFIYFQF